MRLSVLPLLAILSACTNPPPPPAGVPASLHEAHAAWVAADLSALTAAVHTTLADQPSPEVVDNAVALLDTAFQHHPQLPTNQALPEGVRRVSLDHIHRSGPDGHRYRLTVSAVVDVVLEDIRLTGPDLAADRRTATWTTTPEDGGTFVELELPDTPGPATPGLYHLSLVTADGQTTLWTVLGADVATEAPVVTAPEPGSVLADATPDVAVVLEPTPEHAPGEGVGYGVWIASVPDYKGVWSTWSDPPRESVTVDTPLADGRYWLAVSRREVRTLGPVQLGRVARRGVPFVVQAE